MKIYVEQNKLIALNISNNEQVSRTEYLNV